MSTIRDIFWGYFLSSSFRHKRPRDITVDQIMRVNEAVYADKDFWDTIMIEYGNFTKPELMPYGLQEKCAEAFYALIRKKLVAAGIIQEAKPKRKYIRKKKMVSIDDIFVDNSIRIDAKNLHESAFNPRFDLLNVQKIRSSGVTNADFAKYFNKYIDAHGASEITSADFIEKL